MAAGIIRIANVTMSGALRRVSIERGKDPRDFTLVACGGNGPLHAAELAEELGIRTLLIPSMPAHFSAFGMLYADARYDASRTWTCDLPEQGPEVPGLADVLRTLEQGLAGTVAEKLGASRELRFENYAEMRYRGQDQTVKVRLLDDLSPAALQRGFDRIYAERYGHVSPIPVQIVSLRVSCQAALGNGPDASVPSARAHEASTSRQVYSTKAGDFQIYAVHRRGGMARGASYPGPCLVEDHATTTHVPQGWDVRLLEDDVLEMTWSE